MIDIILGKYTESCRVDYYRKETILPPSHVNVLKNAKYKKQNAKCQMPSADFAKENPSYSSSRSLRIPAAMRLYITDQQIDLTPATG